MAPKFLKSNFQDLYGSSMLPALEEMFRSDLELHPRRRDMLFKKRKVSNGIYQASEVHDLQNFNQVNEGAEYSFVAPLQGANKTISTVKYGLGVSISEEAIQDGKFDEVGNMIKQLARSASESQEISAMNIFNNAFTSGTAIDGSVLCATGRTLPSGLTWRNRPSTHVDLSPESLRSMITDFKTQQISDNGKFFSIPPRIILVHSSEEAYAKELIGSQLKPDSADNNMNMLMSEGLMVVSSPHLTDSDAWFLLAPAEQTGLIIVESEGIVTKSQECFDTDSIKYKSRYREQVGIIEAYGVFGTAGI